MKRSVICHFFNEEYLLPWWLDHHKELFDDGIMINHASTDNSVDIIREKVPEWRVVNSQLIEFDAFLTDLEVQNYELQIQGWKIALNVTEFLLPAKPLAQIEADMLVDGKSGCGCMGFICVDTKPEDKPLTSKPLVLQKNVVVADNDYQLDGNKRASLGLPRNIRNRFYHNNPVGMYHPGRHASFNKDFKNLRDDLLIFHYRYAPWTDEGILRKLQIGGRVSQGDRMRGWGSHHLNEVEEWQNLYNKVVRLAEPPSSYTNVTQALHLIGQD